MAFQATFCIVTTALVAGAVVERMRFGPFLVFAALWSVLVYAVLAHWVWGGGWLQTRARSTSPAASRSRWARASPRSPRRSWSARARTTAARRCSRTTRSTCCSARACCGSAGSASTAAAASAPANASVLAFVNTLLTPAATLGDVDGARPAALAPGDRDRRGDGDRRRLRRHHARRGLHLARAGRSCSACSPRCRATR